MVRRKIELHHFELPAELLDCEVTYHLNPSSNPSVVQRAATDLKTQQKPSFKAKPSEAALGQRTASAKNNTSTKEASVGAAAVRGNRVRGGAANTRQPSSKVLTQHQVARPAVSTSSRTASTAPSLLDDDKPTPASDALRRTQSKMAKGVDDFGERAETKDSEARLRAEDKEGRSEQGGDQYSEEGFEEYDDDDEEEDEGDHEALPYRDEEDGFDRDKQLAPPHPHHVSAAETLKSLKAGSSAKWQSDRLDTGPGDMFHQTDATSQSHPWGASADLFQVLSHETGEWNAVWTENRGVIDKGTARNAAVSAKVTESPSGEEDHLQSERESDLFALDRDEPLGSSTGGEDFSEEEDCEQQMAVSWSLRVLSRR